MGTESGVMINLPDKDNSVYEEYGTAKERKWERKDHREGDTYVTVPVIQRESGQVIRILVYWGSGHRGGE